MNLTQWADWNMEHGTETADRVMDSVEGIVQQRMSFIKLFYRF